MNMISFELPEILYKVTRTHLTNEVPPKFLFEVLSQERSWYFKDYTLAQQFCDSFAEDEIIEPISVAEANGQSIIYNLKVVAYLEQIESKNLIPEVFDL